MRRSDHNGRNYQWPRVYRLSLVELGRILGLSEEKGLAVTPLYDATGERVGFRFDGDGRGVQLKNEELRRLLSLPSAKFRVFAGPEETELIQRVVFPPETNLVFVGKGAGYWSGPKPMGGSGLGRPRLHLPANSPALLRTGGPLGALPPTKTGGFWRPQVKYSISAWGNRRWISSVNQVLRLKLIRGIKVFTIPVLSPFQLAFLLVHL